VRKIVWSSPELFLETGRADVSIGGEWAAGTAVGGHRTLNKIDRSLAVHAGTRNAYFDRNEGAR